MTAPTPADRPDDCQVVPTAGEVIAPDDDRLAELSKALGHPARVRIVRLLQDGQACITGDLVGQLGLAQSTVSEHLRILRDAGLIHGEIEGPRTRYCIDATGLATLHAGVAAI